MLEDLVTRARAGEIQSLVVALAGADGKPECAMTMDQGHGVTMVGALRVAEMKLCRKSTRY